MRNAIVFSTQDSAYLGDQIADQLNARRGTYVTNQFADGEREYIVNESDWDALPQHDAVLVGATHDPNNYLEFTDLLATLHDGNARKVMAVIPYAGWSTQERRNVPGQCTTAYNRTRGVYRHSPDLTMWVDLHNSEVAKAHDGRRLVEEVSAAPLFEEYLRNRYELGKLMMVAPDVGRGKAVQRFAKACGIDYTLLFKERTGVDSIRGQEVTRKLDGRTALLFDDMVRTGGTLVNAAERCLEAGADNVVSLATHAVLPRPMIVKPGDEQAALRQAFDVVRQSDLPAQNPNDVLAVVRAMFEKVVSAVDAETRLHDSRIDRVVVTDTHPRSKTIASSKFEVLPIAGLIAERIKRYLDRYAGNGGQV